MTIDPIVAVVDDGQPVRTVLGRVLRLAGYRVAAFACGEDFLASVHAQAPSCVVLDVHMPGLSGLEVHARMRAAGTVVPAVFMTATMPRSPVRRAGSTCVCCANRLQATTW